ncbi:MAG: acyl-CoA dehydrogenase [Actinobacteria bacterium]|nr:acyl-CoA dehydrogenase [Actinomycetota bacterium]
MATTSLREHPLPGTEPLQRLLDQIAEGASERERDRVAPFDEIGLIKEARLGAIRVPVAEGGGGATLRQLFEVLMALAEADSNVAHILRVHFSFVERLLDEPDPARRARWTAVVNEGKVFGNAISEQSANAVGMGFDTLLSPDPAGDGFRLNGEKFYSTGSLYSDYTQIYASTPDERIAAITIPVDREGVSILDDWDGFGQRLTGTGTTRLDDVRVEPDEMVDLGNQQELTEAPGIQGAFLQLYLQAVTVGALRAVRNDAVALVRRRRRSFSHAADASPTGDPQVLQVVGEIAADAFAAEAIVLAAAERIDAAGASIIDGKPDPDLAEAAQLAAAKAKVAIDSFAPRAATALFDAGGASATQAAANLDRHWRNIRTISTHNPTFLKASAVGDHLVNGTPPPRNGFF